MSPPDSPVRRGVPDHPLRKDPETRFRSRLAGQDSPIRLADPQSAHQQARSTRRRRRRRVAIVIAAGAGANVLALTQARSLALDEAGGSQHTGQAGTGELASYSSPEGEVALSATAAEGPVPPPPPPPTTTTSSTTTTTLVVVKAGSSSEGRDLGEFMATCYDNQGETADGQQAGPESVAVDPSVIPLGTHVWIQGVGERVADDTGGAIRGRRIDIWESSATACRDFGVQYLDVREVG